MSADGFTAEDAAWTERACRLFSSLGYRLSEDKSASSQPRFIWQIDGGKFYAKPDSTRRMALMRACVDLCRHIGNPHDRFCPRFFL